MIITSHKTWLPDTIMGYHLSARDVLEMVTTPQAHPLDLKDINEFLGFDRNYVLPPKLEVIEGGYGQQALRVA